MAAYGARFHAVVLVLEQGKELQPLVSQDQAPALLPVANRPVLSYALRLLESCNLAGITLVVSGKAHALQVSTWLAQEQEDLASPLDQAAAAAAVVAESPGTPGGNPLSFSKGSNIQGLIQEVLVVPEGVGSADALRAVFQQTRPKSLDIATSTSGTSSSAGASLGRTGGISVTTWTSTSGEQGTAPAAPLAQDAKGMPAQGGGGAKVVTCTRSESESAEESDSEALGSSRAENLLVLDATAICELDLGAVAAAHCRWGAAVTAVMVPSEASSAASGGGGGGGAGGKGGSHGTDAASKDKGKGGGKGKDGEMKDLVLVDAAAQHQLCFFAPDWSGGAKKSKEGSSPSLRLPREILEAAGGLLLHSDLQDARVYALNSCSLRTALEERPKASCLRKDIIPYLVQQQSVERRAELDARMKMLLLQNPNSVSPSEVARTRTKPPISSLRCCVFRAPRGTFWRRIRSLASFSEANHALLTDEAVHLTGMPLSPNNIIHPSVTLGAKSAVGAHCMVGEGTQLAEKCSVKRSIVGRHCRLGSNVKISDCVIMDYVTLENGSSLQGCIVSSHVTVKELRSLKDCQVAAHVVVSSDEKDASLTK